MGQQAKVNGNSNSLKNAAFSEGCGANVLSVANLHFRQ
jgi:hypothetical protein